MVIVQLWIYIEELSLISDFSSIMLTIYITSNNQIVPPPGMCSVHDPWSDFMYQPKLIVL